MYTAAAQAMVPHCTWLAAVTIGRSRWRSRFSFRETANQKPSVVVVPSYSSPPLDLGATSGEGPAMPGTAGHSQCLHSVTSCADSACQVQRTTS